MNPDKPVMWSSEVRDTPAGHMLIAGDVLLLPAHEAGASPRRSALHALGLPDGSSRWRRDFEDSLVSGLAVVEIPEVTLFVALSAVDLLRGEGALLALDAGGETSWRWSPGARSVSAPAVAGGLVCVTVDSTSLVLLDVNSGEERARIALNANASLAAPLVSEGVAYIPCRGPHLLAVGLDGNLRWRYTFAGESGAWLNKTPVLIGDRVFASAGNLGTAIALAARDGSPLWRAELDRTDKKLSALATDGQRLYLGARDGVRVLDPQDGHALWHFAAERRVAAAPLVAHGVVYAACHDHRLYAIDAATGEELWRHDMPNRIEVSPVVTPDGLHIIVADQGGALAKLARPLDAEELEADGRWAQAAELWQSSGQVERATQAYRRAELWAQAAQLHSAQEQWAEAAECHERVGDWLAAAGIRRDRLHDFDGAGAAFARAARSMPETASSAVVASVWEQALACYEHAQADEQIDVCRREIALLRKLPHVQVRIEPPHGSLTLEHYHDLVFELTNTGGATAFQVYLHHTESEFGGDLKATRQIRTLPVGASTREVLALRALAPGQRVPLDVTVTYADSAGTSYETRHRALLAVQPSVPIDAPWREPVPPDTTYDTAAIRDLLSAAFSDEELTTLCFDHFRAVYDNFGTGMSKGRKIQLLLDYCTRREQFEQLLPLVRERNPAQYARYEPRLQAAAYGAQSEEAHEKSVSGGVDIHSERTDIGGDVTGRDKIESAGGHIIHAGAGATVIVDGKPRANEAESDAEIDVSSLRRQLAESRENLRLVEERKAQFVEETSIPLQLVKDERRLRARIAELEAQLKDQGGD